MTSPGSHSWKLKELEVRPLSVSVQIKCSVQPVSHPLCFWCLTSVDTEHIASLLP